MNTENGVQETPGSPQGLQESDGVRRVDLDELQRLRLRLVGAYERIAELHRELAGHYSAVGTELRQVFVSDVTRAAGIEAGRSATIEIDAGGSRATIHSPGTSTIGTGPESM